MVTSLVKSIAKIGIGRSDDPLVKQRAILTNSLSLATIAFIVGLIVLVIYFGMLNQLFVGFSLMAALIFVFILNHKGFFSAASLLLVNLTSLAITVASLLAYESVVYADTENWLIGFIAVSVFLFDGKMLFLQFVIIFAQMLLAKYVKYDAMNLPMGKDFVIMVSNSVVMCTGIYISLVIVKSALQKTLLNLQKTNEAKRKLLSIIAHDIRSPLSTFEALLSVGKSGIIDQEDFMKHQEELRERFKPLQETIDGVLEWSKIQSEGMVANPIEFDPAPEIRKLIVVYGGIADSKDIKFSFSSHDIQLYMDQDHFKLIMRNLIHNALKFTLEGGTIDIKIHKKNYANKCSIVVRDSGVGMMQESIDGILKKQMISSRQGTKGEVGTGLGLSVSVEIMELNNCDLSIKSKIGEGSSFTVKIPVAPNASN